MGANSIGGGTSEGGNNGIGKKFRELGMDIQGFDFVGFGEAAAGFAFKRGCAVAEGAFHGAGGVGLEGAGRESLNGAGERGDGAERRNGADGSRGDVGVAIGEAGQDEAAGSVDFAGMAGQSETLDAAGGSNIVDASIDDEDGAVWNDGEIIKIGPTAGTDCATQRKQLTGAANKLDIRHPTGGGGRAVHLILLQDEKAGKASG